MVFKLKVQKKIRQLIRQRKERDEQIAQLIQQNEKLKNSYSTKETEFNKVSRLNLDATEKQLKDKLDLARSAYAMLLKHKIKKNY